eukprot:c18695_g2_i1 orf=162-344(-)
MPAICFQLTEPAMPIYRTRLILNEKSKLKYSSPQNLSEYEFQLTFQGKKCFVVSFLQLSS